MYICKEEKKEFEDLLKSANGKLQKMGPQMANPLLATLLEGPQI
jgi:hypothetical protein